MRVSDIEQCYRKRLLIRFGDPSTLSPEDRLQALIRKAEDVLETASHRARRMAVHAEEQARLISQRAEEEARQRGRALGLQEAARETAARRRESELLLEELLLLRHRLMEDARRNAVRLARRLALSVLGLPQETCPEPWMRAFERLLAQQPSDGNGRPVVVECHPDQARALSSLEPVLRGMVRLDADARVPRMRFRLFAEEGVIELDPARRLEEILAAEVGPARDSEGSAA